MSKPFPDYYDSLNAMTHVRLHCPKRECHSSITIPLHRIPEILPTIQQCPGCHADWEPVHPLLHTLQCYLMAPEQPVFVTLHTDKPH